VAREGETASGQSRKGAMLFMSGLRTGGRGLRRDAAEPRHLVRKREKKRDVRWQTERTSSALDGSGATRALSSADLTVKIDRKKKSPRRALKGREGGKKVGDFSQEEEDRLQNLSTNPKNTCERLDSQRELRKRGDVLTYPEGRV